MPIELGVWRLGEEASSLPHQGMDDERRLEQLLEKDIGIIASRSSDSRTKSTSRCKASVNCLRILL
jgi:hypothetical protein